MLSILNSESSIYQLCYYGTVDVTFSFEKWKKDRKKELLPEKKEEEIIVEISGKLVWSKSFYNSLYSLVQLVVSILLHDFFKRQRVLARQWIHSWKILDIYIIYIV